MQNFPGELKTLPFEAWDEENWNAPVADPIFQRAAENLKKEKEKFENLPRQ